MTTTQNANINTQTEVKPDFGAGRYSSLMAEIYRDSQATLSLTSAQAEKLARNISSDLGAWFKTAQAEVKLGNTNKDGQFKSIKEACQVKNIPATNALMILKAMQYMNDAFKNGISRKDTGWKLTPTLQEYVDNLA